MSRNYVRQFDPSTDGLLVLAAGMSGDAGAAIQAQERAGQNQLVASAVMPTQVGDRAEYEALGFVFGAVVDGDPLFTHCTLPEGWSKAGSDHDMWSYVLDQLGRRRVAVFYKAAFYDRDAFARLETPVGYLRHVLYERLEPVLDDVWLTPQIADETLATLAVGYEEKAAEADGFAARDSAPHWKEYAAEDRQRANEAQALRARIAATQTT